MTIALRSILTDQFHYEHPLFPPDEAEFDMRTQIQSTAAPDRDLGAAVAAMKREISIEALTGPNDGVLVGVTGAVRGKRLALESLIWSELADTNEARIWMIVSADEVQYRELLVQLAEIPGITQIGVLGPGQALIKSLFETKVLP